MHDICERATPKVSAVGAGPVGAVGAIRPMAGLHSLASAAVPAGGGAPTGRRPTAASAALLGQWPGTAAASVLEYGYQY